MEVTGITNGIVIDHIPAGQAMRLYRDLKLGELDCRIAIIKNVPSDKLGKKDLLKIDDIIEINDEILGFIDSRITVTKIKNSKSIEKYNPPLPEKISGILRCKNPRCITSTEQELTHVFCLTNREKIIYRCIYCETKAEKQMG